LRAATLVESRPDPLGKAILDRVGAALLLVALAPLMAVVAALVRLTSSGPVVFAQTRVGQGGRPFQVLKFRSMVKDAESLEDSLAGLRRAGVGPFFKVHADERVTPLGRFLRQFSLDELPQLVNVLRGEMSLVGPRPLLVREFDELPQEVREWRFCVKPGLTGLWQVSGRSRTTDATRLRLDRLYVEHGDLLTDLIILARTPMAVLRAEGAV
jgi:lipopolysaccharide/colanic/teichoic acid biosynthesis glycosyltransferase